MVLVSEKNDHHFVNLMEVRPLNLSMCPDKAIAATGIMPNSVASVCKEVAKQFNSDV